MKTDKELFKIIKDFDNNINELIKETTEKIIEENDK